MTSNVMYAMLNDVTDFEDRDLASGIYFAGTNLVVVVLNGLPALLILTLGLVKGENLDLVYLFYQLGLSILFFVLLFFVQIPSKLNPTSPRSSECATPADAAPSKPNAFSVLVEPVRLMMRHAKLRRLCCTAFLFSLAGGLVMNIGMQYFTTSLNLRPYGTKQELRTVSVLSTLPGQLLVLPGFLVTGYLSQIGGSLKLLRRLVPLSALLIASGAVLSLLPALWCVPLVVVAQNYAGLPNVPLFRLISGVAPPGRTGEAMSAAGMAQQAGGLLVSVIILCVNPMLLTAAEETGKRLWLYYPVGGLLALLALLPLWGTPRGGWGAAAGRVDDEAFAVAMAHVSQSRWRQLVRRRKEERARAQAELEAAGVVDLEGRAAAPMLLGRVMAHLPGKKAAAQAQRPLARASSNPVQIMERANSGHASLARAATVGETLWVPAVAAEGPAADTSVPDASPDAVTPQGPPTHLEGVRCAAGLAEAVFASV